MKNRFFNAGKGCAIDFVFNLVGTVMIAGVVCFGLLNVSYARPSCEDLDIPPENCRQSGSQNGNTEGNTAIDARISFNIKADVMIDGSTKLGQESLQKDFKVILIPLGSSGKQIKGKYNKFIDNDGYYSATVQFPKAGNGTFALQVKHLNSNRVIFNNIKFNVEENVTLNCFAAQNENCGELQKWKTNKELRLFMTDANGDGFITEHDKNFIKSKYYTEVTTRTNKKGILTNEYKTDLNKDGLVDGKDLAACIRGLKYFGKY
jgi:hypothetical protein